MGAVANMLGENEVRARARTLFSRNWRDWAAGVFATGDCAPELAMGLKPPRECDLTSREGAQRARVWTASWRACSLPGAVEWQRRSWPRVGDQDIPVRIRISGAHDIACWADALEQWKAAIKCADDVAMRIRHTWNDALRSSPTLSVPAELPSLSGDLVAIAPAVKTSIGEWVKLDARDWERALGVWDWLLAHPGERRFARELPIRGVDTKWIEARRRTLRPLYEALTGLDLAFKRPEKQFRCVACDSAMELGGCREFSLTALQLDALAVRPRAVVVCENLVNVLCLSGLGDSGGFDDCGSSRGLGGCEDHEGFGDFGRSDVPGGSDAFEGVLAIHGGGYAVSELASVSWLRNVPLVYWGDLDSNGFAILDIVRGIVPQARSAMMDAETLRRHLDLCVQEDKPASGALSRLTLLEREALSLLQRGDSSRGIVNLRLEQERIGWDWALRQLREALSG